jgi:uncharacterized protein with PhoU and TrkA domain
MEHIEIIKDNEEILAIIIRKDYTADGLKFFTPDDFSQQLAYMHHKKGKVIEAHTHNSLKREIHFTQEVLLLKRGKLKVDIYRSDQSFLSTFVLTGGDVILLAGGGHGFEALEDIEMIEVKQGPYSGDMDKTHLSAES